MITPDVFKKRVQIGAFILMGLTTIYVLYYAYISYERALRFSFWEPEIWTNLHFVDADAVIPFAARVGYFAIWGGVITVSVCSTLCAIYLLNLCRKGVLFAPQTARAIQWVGGGFFILMVLDTIFGAVDRHLLSRYNESDVIPIAFNYDPSDLKVMVLACVIFLFGWAMREGIAIEATNKEFV